MPGYPGGLGPSLGGGLVQAARDSQMPLRTSPRLDKLDIVQLKNDYRSYHQKRIQQHREDEAYFRLEYYVPSPDGRSPLKSPAAYQIVEELINHVAAQSPVFTVEPRGQGEKAQQLSGKQTTWLNGFWHKTKITKLLRHLVWYDAVRGCHVLRVLYDPGSWPLRPENPVLPAEPEDLINVSEAEFKDYTDALIAYRKDRERYQDDLQDYRDYTEEHLPFDVRAVDPMYCYWEPGEDPQSMVIAWERPVDDVLRKFPETWEYLSGVKPGTKVTWCEYWDRRIKAYWIESYGSNGRGQGLPNWVVEPMEHEFGFFPFIVDGPWQTPLEDPESHFPSIYYSTKPMLQYESTLLTQIAHVIRIIGWSPIIVKTDKPEGQKPIIDMTPGHHNYIEADENVGYLNPDGNALAILDKMVESAQGYTDRGSGLSDALRGTPKGKSGYQQAQIQASAQVPLVPVEHCLERTLETSSLGVLKLIRLVGERIAMQGLGGDRNNEASLGPEDVREVGRIAVHLKSIMPMDESAKVNNYANMVKLGWISNVTAARLVGIENPEEERERAMAEAIAKQPEVQAAMAQLYASEHWPELAAAMEKIAQAGGGQGPPGKRGPPKGSDITSGNPIGKAAGPKPPAGPGSANESSLAGRQAAQGGTPPSHLSQAPG